MTDMLNIALPKGRLGEKVYNLLKQAGYACPAGTRGTGFSCTKTGTGSPSYPSPSGSCCSCHPGRSLHSGTSQYYFRKNKNH